MQKACGVGSAYATLAAEKTQLAANLEAATNEVAALKKTLEEKDKALVEAQATSKSLQVEVEKMQKERYKWMNKLKDFQHVEDQVCIIHENLKAAQSHQKSQCDRHHQDMVYQPGEKAYLRVTPLRGAHHFGIKGKLAPRYIGPFTVLERCGRVAYQLELPANLSQVHDVFHVFSAPPLLQGSYSSSGS